MNNRCPNLIPSGKEQNMTMFRNVTSFEVSIPDEVKEERYASLADMWSEWNLQYADAEFPRLLIRFEDVLFHAEKVVSAIANCSGIQMTNTMQHPRAHPEMNGISEALTQYGSTTDRFDDLISEDKSYAQKALDQQLMRIFHYAQPGRSNKKPFKDILNEVDNFNGSLAALQAGSNMKACAGKERFLGIAMRAGYTNITEGDCVQLPTWDEVVRLYGEGPIIVGLDTCARYRAVITEAKEAGMNVTPSPRVAGLFNSGTNALAQSFSMNLRPVEDYKEYNVLSRKHVAPRDKWVYDQRFVDDYDPSVLRYTLPIVLVRDPFRWMTSMCKRKYNVRWATGKDGRCPNLVFTKEEREMLQTTNQTYIVDVTVRDVHHEQYKSIADFWSEWNRLHVDTFRPRLMIRFEDTLFHAEKVMERIGQCLGVPLLGPFQYKLDASKKHGESSNFFSALAKYGKADGRYTNFTSEERAYLQSALDPLLLELFHYPQIPLE
jgi:hypothetical protein